MSLPYEPASGPLHISEVMPCQATLDLVGEGNLEREGEEEGEALISQNVSINQFQKVKFSTKSST
jgi:hypothetical protein